VSYTRGYDPQTGEWNDSLLGEFLWSSVNVSEAVPDVMTPATWSLWQILHHDANPIRVPGDYAFCGNICGRPYLNLSLVVSLYHALGKDMREELHGDLIASAPADLDVPVIRFSPLAVIWKVLPGMLKAQRYAGGDGQHIPRFVAGTPDWCRDVQAKVRGAGDRTELLTVWRATIRPYFLQACRLLRSVTMSFSDPATSLHLELNRLVGEADANALLSNLSGPSLHLESLGPVLGLAQVADGTMKRDEYMRRYGHRGPHEMELFAPGADEDPDWLEKRLAELGQPATSVASLLENQRAERGSAWQRFEISHPREVAGVQRRLEVVASAARTREAVRSEVTRLTRLVRRYVLRCGEVTGLGDSVFFLSLDEIAAVLSGDTASTTLIPARRTAYDRYASLPPYPGVIVGSFDPFRWASDPHRRTDYYDARSGSAHANLSTIKGFAGAAGRVEGVVRRLDRPEDGTALQQGEVLVTVTTNVGWTLLFPRLAAVVTDVGAPLSHAAIVARELGIPAVVGCGDATARLKTGDRVRVDGSRGVVELLGDEHR
jgi:pyruvate,water dikinase